MGGEICTARNLYGPGRIRTAQAGFLDFSLGPSESLPRSSPAAAYLPQTQCLSQLYKLLQSRSCTNYFWKLLRAARAIALTLSCCWSGLKIWPQAERSPQPPKFGGLIFQLSNPYPIPPTVQCKVRPALAGTPRRWRSQTKKKGRFSR